MIFYVSVLMKHDIMYILYNKHIPTVHIHGQYTILDITYFLTLGSSCNLTPRSEMTHSFSAEGLLIASGVLNRSRPRSDLR